MNIVSSEKGNYVITEAGLICSRETIFDVSNQLLIVRKSTPFLNDRERIFKFSEIDSYDVSHKRVTDDNSIYDRYWLMLKLNDQNVFWDIYTEDYGDFVRLKNIIEDCFGVDNISRDLDRNMVICGGCMRYISPVEKRFIYCGNPSST